MFKYSYVVLFVVCVNKALTDSLSAINHCKEVLFDKQGIITHNADPRITQMVFDVLENTLYFIYRNSSQNIVGSLNIETKTSKNDYQIENPTCIAINQWTNKVYVGTTEGIYLLNGLYKSTNKPERLELEDSSLPSFRSSGLLINVQNMYFEGHMINNGHYVERLYYTDNMNEVWSFARGTIRQSKYLAGVYAEKIVLYDEHLFFTKGKSLFHVKLGQPDIYTYKQYVNKVNILAADTKNTPYIATDDGVYVLETKKKGSDKYHSFRKVFDIKGLKALTFDKHGQPIYTTAEKLVYFKFQGCDKSVPEL